MNFVIHVNTLITNDKKQILLVKEKKEKVFNKLNFPGGHLEFGEELVAGARREAMEEVGVEIDIHGLIGIYSGLGVDHYFSFIFAGKIIGDGKPVANKSEINDCGWYSIDEIGKIPDDQILNPVKLRKAIADYESSNPGSLGLIREMN